MNKYERIEKLDEAQEKISEAVDLISEAVKGTSLESSAQAYIIGHLQNWAEGHNPYDQTIPVLIELLEEKCDD